MTTKRHRRHASVTSTARAKLATPTQLADELHERMLHRRAVEAAIWGLPMVSFDAMRQAFLRDAGAKYNDIVFSSRAADWRFQIPTPDASTYYAVIMINTKGGPLVLDIPPAIGAGLSGSINDAWQTPLVDVGPAGADDGKGARYVLLPPGYADAVPANLIRVPMNTYGGYCLLRAIPRSSSAEDIAEALRLVRRLRLYLLAQMDDPPEQYHVDISNRQFDGAVRFDGSFFESLARMVHEEPVQPRDLVAMNHLASIGIEKGKLFHPDELMSRVLNGAIEEAQEQVMIDAMTGQPFWPDGYWVTVGGSVGRETAFSYETTERLAIDERAAAFFLACALPRKPGAAVVALLTHRDANGDVLEGSNMYRLRVPPHPPARQFWAVTAYDRETAAFMRESPRVELSSVAEHVVAAPDGGVDVYFGPTPPSGREMNWVYTAPGKRWFAMFRLCGPMSELFDGEWRLAEFERV